MLAKNTHILRRLVEERDLPISLFKREFEALVEGNLSVAEASAFLIALKMAGETTVQLTEAARFLRKKALVMRAGRGIILDTCGTGGSGFNKLNISTAVFFILSSAGIKVARHGNRAASGRCGSADVMEALGIPVTIKPVYMKKVFERTGMAYLFAPFYHPALKNLAGLRKELGVRTIFNILGPMCNPYLVKYQILGVSKRDLLLPMAEALCKLGTKNAFIVHSGGLDEASLHAPVEVAIVKNSRVRGRKVYFCKDFGLKRASLKDIEVKNTPKINSRMILDIFSGKLRDAHSDMVILNASLGYVLSGKASSFKEAVRSIKQMISRGDVLRKYKYFKKEVERYA